MRRTGSRSDSDNRIALLCPGSGTLLYPPGCIAVGEVRQEECLDLLVALDAGVLLLTRALPGVSDRADGAGAALDGGRLGHPVSGPRCARGWPSKTSRRHPATCDVLTSWSGCLGFGQVPDPAVADLLGLDPQPLAGPVDGALGALLKIHRHRAATTTDPGGHRQPNHPAGPQRLPHLDATASDLRKRRARPKGFEPPTS